MSESRRRFVKAVRTVECANAYREIANPRWKLQIVDYKVVDSQDVPLVASVQVAGRCQSAAVRTAEADEACEAAVREILARQGRGGRHARRRTPPRRRSTSGEITARRSCRRRRRRERKGTGDENRGGGANALGSRQRSEGTMCAVAARVVVTRRRGRRH